MKIDRRWFRWILILPEQTWLDWIRSKDSNCPRVLSQWKRHFFNASILIKIIFLCRVRNQFAAHFCLQFGLGKDEGMKFIAAAIYDDEKRRQRLFLALISIFYSWASHFYEVGVFNGRSFLLFINSRFAPLQVYKSSYYLQEPNALCSFSRRKIWLRALLSIFAHESCFCYLQIKAERAQIFAARNKQKQIQIVAVVALPFFPIKFSWGVWAIFTRADLE